jgi:hypothetical protein
MKTGRKEAYFWTDRRAAEMLQRVDKDWCTGRSLCLEANPRFFGLMLEWRDDGEPADSCALLRAVS